MNIQRFLSIQLFLLLLLLLPIKECGSKRSGGLFGGRGTSAGRSGGLFGGFRKSGGGSSGTFSGSRSVGGAASSAKSGYPRNSNWGTHGIGNIGRTHGDRWGSRSSGSWGRPRNRGLFTKSNIGSFIAGAAAGYLTYKAGRALIRSAYTPMMWNNRPYYWGSNYYRGSHGTHMCRMPVEADDPQLGNVYFEDGGRPKELVWSCNYNEYCCGYDCCWRGGISTNWNRGFANILLIVVAIVHFI